MAQRYQEIVEGIGEGIIQIDDASLITYANPAMCVILGRPYNELLGQSVAQYIVDEAAAPVPARLVDRRKGPDERAEVAWIGRDGTIVPTRTSEHVLFNVDGTVAGKLSVVTDLTELKISQRIERELASTSPSAARLSQLRYAHLFDTTREALLFIDERTLRVLDVNPAATLCLGFDAADLRGHAIGDVPMFADAATKKLVIEGITERQGEIRLDAVELQTREGRRFFGDLLGDRYAVDGGRIVQLSIRDATDRVTALRKLNDEELQYRAIIEQGCAGVYVMTEDLKFQYLSPRFAEILGYLPSEILGRSILDLIPESERASATKLAAEHFSGSSPKIRFTSKMNRKNGGAIDVIVDASLGTYDGRISSNGAVIDISEQRAIEHALVLRNAILTTQQELSPDGILVIGNDGSILSRNRRFIELFGTGPMEHAFADPAAAVERDAYRREHPSEEFHGEALLADGRTLECNCAPIVGTDGIPQGHICTFHDITVHKEQELHLLRVTRFLKTLSACNSTLIHATDEATLLHDMCQIIVDTGDYPLAAISVAELDDAKTLQVIACAGNAVGYLDQAQLTWSPDSTLGRGPNPTAIRSKAIVINNDFSLDPLPDPWRERALRYNLQSGIAIPFEYDGRRAAITICSAEPSAFAAEESALFRELADDLMFGLATLETKNKHDALLTSLEKSLDATVQAIGRAVEFRDPYTAGHELRVAKLAVEIAEEMGLSEDQKNAIRIASLVHDIGKINVPSEILTRPGKLSSLEFELIKLHPQAGADILKDIDFPWPISTIVLQHHERLDGSGYPQGLKGNDILIEARVLAVADVMESMSSNRPYRPHHPIEDALDELLRGRGRLYEPAAVDVCRKLFETFSFETKTEAVADNVSDIWRP